jgi:precorrin-6A/cobalt-precorrin-6A reductase
MVSGLRRRWLLLGELTLKTILLLGGTGVTREIALGIARAGYRVLVSRATGVPLAVGEHAQIECRWGPLDEGGLAELIAVREIKAVVDATHPYAMVIRATARRVAGQQGIPYFSFLRPAVVEAGDAGVEFAPDHAAAAAAAFAYGRPVLLSTGAKNLAPYADAARRTGLPLVVRVLERPESRATCRQAQIPDERVLTGRGPFSLEENRRHIRQFAVGVLVTKDSGRAGGTPEKLQAAKAENCRVVVVRRPETGHENSFAEVQDLLRALRERLG